MNIIIVLLTLLSVLPARAGTHWNHNGSNVELVSDGATREFQYFTPRPGLPVKPGTVLFRGTANGNRYLGTAYVFSSVCGAVGYTVSGNVSIIQKSITLYGKAPSLDSRCDVVGYRNDVLLFSFSGCGCECGDEIELAAIRPPAPNYTGSTSTAEAHSCPYLYAWSDRDAKWHSYGKVIREARGENQKMTDVIKLSTFSTKFRLAEEEPEHSFIHRLELRVELRDGSQVLLKPVTKRFARRSKGPLYIPAFGAIEFAFKLPPWIEPANVEQASLLITGYYEILSEAPMCRAPIAISGK